MNEIINVQNGTILKDIEVKNGIVYLSGKRLKIENKNAFWFNNKLVDTHGIPFDVDVEIDDEKDTFLYFEEQICVKNGCPPGYICQNKGRNVYECVEIVEDYSIYIYIFCGFLIFVCGLVIFACTGPAPEEEEFICKLKVNKKQEK